MIDWKDCIVPEYTPSTLCEICQNACGGCAWSKYGEQKPVEGWEAIRNDLYVNHGTVTAPISFIQESYVVLACPEFEPDRFADRFPFRRSEAERRAKLRIASKLRGEA